MTGRPSLPAPAGPEPPPRPFALSAGRSAGLGPSGPDPAVASCGDGFLQPGEQCDDG
ncbi:DUF4215 domain-containing protein, partial [Rhodococcus sp. (in: high G+C Gram-positive bacteria)]|uniref:DUF4215 domain-containing protein n=1 Tax=Rhodococcus sp. TaxID=1831 RepID=UPI00338D5C1F